MKKPNTSKYELIIEYLLSGKPQSEIIEELHCSYGTIQTAKKWGEREKGIVFSNASRRKNTVKREKNTKSNGKSISSSTDRDLLYIQHHIIQLETLVKRLEDTAVFQTSSNSLTLSGEEIRYIFEVMNERSQRGSKKNRKLASAVKNKFSTLDIYLQGY